jgi:hypothetical protein
MRFTSMSTMGVAFAAHSGLAPGGTVVVQAREGLPRPHAAARPARHLDLRLIERPDRQSGPFVRRWFVGLVGRRRG